MRTRSRKGNLLDLSLILLLVLCLLGVGLRWRMQRRGEGGTEQIPCRVTVLLERLPAEWPRCVEIGERLYFADGTRFGEVLSLTVLPAGEPLTVGDAEAHMPWGADRLCSVRAELLVMGTWQEGVLLREGAYALPLGSRLTLYSSRAEWQLLVLFAEPLSGEGEASSSTAPSKG